MRCTRCELVKWTLPMLMLWLSSLAYAGSTNGYARTENCNQLNGLHLYINRLDARPLEKTIVLKVPQPYLADIFAKDKQWFPAPAMRCVAEGQCEDAASAQVQILKSEARRLSGKFRATLHDGTILEGEFRVKFRKAKRKIICE